MKLTTKMEIMTWPETHYIYLEKEGPFLQTAPACWQEFQKLMPAIADHNKITGAMALYRLEPKMIYRAGVAVASAPGNLPEGVQYTKFKGGKYARYVLTGSYANLPQACAKVFEMMKAEKIEFRQDFGIENYVNDPRTTPEDQLITEIMVPVA